MNTKYLGESSIFFNIYRDIHSWPSPEWIHPRLKKLIVAEKNKVRDLILGRSLLIKYNLWWLAPCVQNLPSNLLGLYYICIFWIVLGALNFWRWRASASQKP